MTTKIAQHTLAETAAYIAITRLDALDKQIQALAAEKKEIVQRFGSANGNGKHEVKGFGAITISANVSYDGASMTAALKPGQFRLASKRVIDPAKVKAQYPDVYADARKDHGYKAAVKVYSD